jgi:hypothetical protein
VPAALGLLAARWTAALFRRCHPSRWTAAPSWSSTKTLRGPESLSTTSRLQYLRSSSQWQEFAEVPEPSAAGGFSCGGGLSSQISGAALSQSSSESVISSNAIIHAGCWRRQASYSFRCNQRSCRLIILHTRTPGGWFGRRGRSEDARRGAFDYVPPGNSMATPRGNRRGRPAFFSQARLTALSAAVRVGTLGRPQDYWRRHRGSRHHPHQINIRVVQ